MSFRSGPKEGEKLVVAIILIILVVILIIYILRRFSDESRNRIYKSKSTSYNLSKSYPHKSNNDKSSLYAMTTNNEDVPTCNHSGENKYAKELTTSEFIGRFPVFKELVNAVGKGSGRIENYHLLPGAIPKVMVRGKKHNGYYHNHEDGCNCQECKEGGIGDRCEEDKDCACGLECLGLRCVCPKPPPPELRLQVRFQSITVTWSPVYGADYYDIYLATSSGSIVSIQLFYTDTVITFSNLDPGFYYVFAFSGSSDCGMLPQYTQSNSVQVGTCGLDIDCPSEAPICLEGTCVECEYNGHCTDNLICIDNQCVPECITDENCLNGEVCRDNLCRTPECEIDNDCPEGRFCQEGFCENGCINSNNCPTDTSCINGQCVPLQCTIDTDCVDDEICIDGECACPVPEIIGVRSFAHWPGPMQFQFEVTGSDPNGAVFTVPWRAHGLTGILATSGFSSGTYLPDYKWPETPYYPFPANPICQDFPCCSSIFYGCPSLGCGGPADVVFDIIGVTVTNKCGKTSNPTCWRFSSLCPGGSMYGVQIDCDTVIVE